MTTNIVLYSTYSSIIKVFFVVVNARARISIQHKCIKLLTLKKNCLFYGLFRNETCFHCIEGTKRSHDKHKNRMIYNISDILELKECTLFNMLKPFIGIFTLLLHFHLFFIINVNKLWVRCYKRSKGLMTSEYYHLSIKASRFIKKI